MLLSSICLLKEYASKIHKSVKTKKNEQPRNKLNHKIITYKKVWYKTLIIIDYKIGYL